MMPTQEQEPEDFRELLRQQTIESIGGWVGAAIAAIPTIVFAVVNTLAALRTALIAAVGAAVFLTAVRLVRRESTQQALSGLFGVAIAALVAAKSGEAKNFFLPGIVFNAAYAAAFALSIAVRRPLVGVAWEFLYPSPGVPHGGWNRVPALLRAYSYASALFLGLFASKVAVQYTLFKHDQTGWLAVARIGMGFPLYVAVLLAVFVLVRRARHSLPRPEPVVEDEADMDDKEEAADGADAPAAD